MTERRKMRIIQTAYWLGIVADALWAVALVYPPLYGILTGNPDFDPDLPYRLTMGIGASLMAGWTFLLAWAAIQPVERRGVLLLTVFPVIAGLARVSIVGIVYGGATNYWILGKISILAISMLGAYHLADKIAKEKTNEIDY